MAGEASLGRAVLELSTDGKQLDAGLADVPKKVKKTGEAVKDLAGPLTQVNGLLETFGVGLSIGAVVAFGKSILDMADNITKVHDRTGLATDDVQRLQYIAEQSGNSIDDLAGSISKLQVRLADGKAQKGIENLGLNFKKIRESTPYEALAQVAEAIGKIENPTLRAQRAVEVFGKAGTEILPTLVSNFRELGDSAPVMSEETVAALDAAGDAIARFGTTLKVWAAESYNYARGFFDRLVAEAYRMVQRLYENAAGLAALAAKLPGASKLGIDQKLVDSLKESAVWYSNVAKAMDTNTVAAKKNAPAVAALPPIHKEASKEAKAHAEAIANLTEKLSGAGAIKAANDLREALARLPPITRLTKDAQLEIAKTMETAIAVYAAAGQSIPRDLQLIAMAARASSNTVNDATKLQIEAMQKAWSQVGGIKLAAIPVAFGFEDPTWATRQTLAATRSFVGVVSQIDAVAVGKAAAQRIKDAFGPTFWQKIFGTPAQLKGYFTQSFGDLAGMLSSVINGSMGLGAAFKSYATDVAKDFTSGALAIIPVVGPMLAKFAGPIVDGLKKAFGAIFGIHGSAGRDLVTQFAGTMGGFDALHVKLGELGAEGERLWIALTQGVGANNPEQAHAAIDAVTAALAAQKDQIAATAAESEQSAADVAAAHAEAVDAIKARYAEGFKAIDDEYKKLNDSVAAEAEEADMGAQERQDRARMAELEKQRAALEQQQNDEVAAKEATFGQVLEAGRETRTELEAIFGGETLKIPYEFVPKNGFPSPIPMAGGGAGRVTRPTLFYSRGDEDYAFSGEGRSFGLGALASRPIEITNITELDGRELARNQIRHMPNQLARVGVRSR